jgi:hypothetical protein
MIVPLKEIDIFGVFVAPTAVALVVSAAVFLILRRIVNQFVDLNRYVWRRPLLDIALFVVLYSLVNLAMRPV